MSLFQDDPWYQATDKIIDQIQELAHRMNDAMKLRETLMLVEGRASERLRNELSLELGRLVQAVADLGREDHDRQGDELGADDDGQRA